MKNKSRRKLVHKAIIKFNANYRLSLLNLLNNRYLCANFVFGLFAARRFDFFDMGMMDILQYRLEKAESIMRGPEVEVTFKGRIIGKRQSVVGDDEFRVTWTPSNM